LKVMYPSAIIRTACDAVGATILRAPGARGRIRRGRYMEKFKRVMGILMSNALFWIFLILGTMVLFILRYERPVNFVVDRIYNLF
jgi:hypothetical protein